MKSSFLRHFTLVIVIITTAQWAGWSQSYQGHWTLDSCLNYAVSNSIAVQKSQWQAKSSKAEMNSAIGGFIPTFDSQVSGEYSWGRNIDPETNTYKTQTTFNNYYNLSSSLTLFDGGRTINQFRQAKAKREFALNNVNKASEDKEIEVMQKFVDLVYAKACVDLASDKLRDSKRLLAKTEALEELGLKGKPDVAQISAQVAEDDYNFTHQSHLAGTALLALKSSMNYPIGDSLEVDTLLTHIVPEYRLEDAENIYSYALDNSMQAKTAIFNASSAKYSFNIQKGRLIPSLRLFAGVSTNYYKNITTPGSVSGFNNQFKNNMGEYVGATLSIPLFDYSSYGNVKKSYCDMKAAELDKEEALRKLHDDIAQAVMDRNGYVKEIEQMEKKVEADGLSYEQTRRKFEEGMLSSFDLRTAANTLLQSKVSLLQMRMLYVLKDRLVDYYKGIGIIRANN